MPWYSSTRVLYFFIPVSKSYGALPRWDRVLIMVIFLPQERARNRLCRYCIETGRKHEYMKVQLKLNYLKRTEETRTCTRTRVHHPLEPNVLQRLISTFFLAFLIWGKTSLSIYLCRDVCLFTACLGILIYDRDQTCSTKFLGAIPVQWRRKSTVKRTKTAAQHLFFDTGPLALTTSRKNCPTGKNCPVGFVGKSAR